MVRTRYDDSKDDVIFRTAENGKRYAINTKTGDVSGLGKIKKFKKERGGSSGALKEEDKKIAKAHGIDADETIRSVQEDSDWQTINPNYGKSTLWSNNCGACVVAYDMRRRGLNVTATPRRSTNVSDFKRYYDGFEWTFTEGARKASSKKDLDAKLTAMGDGARGVIFVEWDGRTFGHFFNFEVEGDQVHYINPQSKSSADGYFDRVKPSKTRYARTDNLTLKDDAFSCVKKGEQNG